MIEKLKNMKIKKFTYAYFFTFLGKILKNTNPYKINISRSEYM